MLATTLGCALSGIEGRAVTVEVNIASGMPAFDVVGLPDTAVRESRDRVRAALKNSGFGFPDTRITVNLAPADQKKEGSAFDLPIAAALIAAQGRLPLFAVKDAALIGELSLDGTLRPVRGALPMAISLRSAGVRQLILPEACRAEVACVDGLTICPARHLRDVVAHLSGDAPLEPLIPVSYETLLREDAAGMDFDAVKGQSGVKRALEIAAGGGHNVLMIGEPGSGKTLMARCVPSILPAMTFEEALEVTRIHSSAGLPVGRGLLTSRPFCAPHHTASAASLIGGGANALPGEISRAHQGVLFLDELPEYRRDVLEALRQPMEDGFVTVTRVNAQSTYPAAFMLICSMNPCPCGHYGSRLKECRCTPNQIRRYVSRVSGPLLDRIDLHVEVESVPPDRISGMAREESSKDIRARVEKTREIQRRRYKGLPIDCNARLDARSLDTFCPMDDAARALLTALCEKMGLSSRAYARIVKVARTIADMEESETLQSAHVAEAAQYRALDRKYWG